MMMMMMMMMMIMMIATDSMNLCHEYNYYNNKKEHDEFVLFVVRAVTKVYYVRVL